MLERLVGLDVSHIAGAIAAAIDWCTQYLSDHFGAFFDFVAAVILGIEHPLAVTLNTVPWWIVLLVVVAIALWAGGVRLALLSGLGLILVFVLNLWGPTMETLALVITAVLLALAFGIPLGIAVAESRKFGAVMEPMLDFMQTMPPFVLLVPAVFFFGVGAVPGVVATIFFAMPLPIRLTAHGLTMVEQELVEAGEAFGAGRLQLLYLVKLPLAFRSIMAGVNQCIMMSLSMVIIASMIGAGGLGNEIIRAISRLQIGQGVEAGLAVVILAIIIDRLSKGLSRSVDPAA